MKTRRAILNSRFTPYVHEYSAFSNPERITIRGYSGFAMEPFITHDGRYLFFNNANDPAVDTNLHYAEKLNGVTFAYKKIDPNRIYVVGMSNGGYFAHLVGKERSETVAAMASHSGALGLQTLGGIKARRKFPVLIIHGDRDRILPVAWARENRDKYRKEGHEVTYIELKGQGHMWATRDNINETIWKFFSDHPKG